MLTFEPVCSTTTILLIHKCLHLPLQQKKPFLGRRRRSRRKAGLWWFGGRIESGTGRQRQLQNRPFEPASIVDIHMALCFPASCHKSR